METHRCAVGMGNVIQLPESMLMDLGIGLRKCSIIKMGTGVGLPLCQYLGHYWDSQSVKNRRVFHTIYYAHGDASFTTVAGIVGRRIGTVSTWAR